LAGAGGRRPRCRPVPRPVPVREGSAMPPADICCRIV